MITTVYTDIDVFMSSSGNLLIYQERIGGDAMLACDPKDVPGLCKMLYKEAGLQFPATSWTLTKDRLPTDAGLYLVFMGETEILYPFNPHSESGVQIWKDDISMWFPIPPKHVVR